MMKNQVRLQVISANDLQQAEGAYLVDVRSSMEFEEKHIPGAELHPLHELDPSRLKEKAQGRCIFLVCSSGNRARQAATKLTSAGLDEVTVLDGGLQAWEQANLPLRHGKKGISLERQVRIAAGALVLLGVLAGSVIHPAFLVISGFVGAGLIFAGITDWCGMGLFLARMPWNKTRPSCCVGKN